MATRRPSGGAAPPFPRDGWALAALEKEGLLSQQAARQLRAEAPEWIATLVLERGLAEPERLAAILARACRVPVARLDAIEPSCVQFVPETAARQYAALPLAATNRNIRIATANPMDLDAERALGFVAGRQVQLEYAAPGPLLRRLEEVYRPERSIERLVSGLGPQATVEAIEEKAEVVEDASVDAPAARLVDATIADAVRERASDIHFEPGEGGLAIRYRVDGVMREVMRVPRTAAGAVTRRMKIIARLDIADPLRPHDGRAVARVDGKVWDLRVSSIPIARYGEKVVARLLDPNTGIIALGAMGLWPDEQAGIESLLGHREGIVLVTGPTGSGKTTTLYAALDRIRSKGINVVTVEDPVEYELPGVNQVQVNEKAGLTFASALRSVLRQDPDVVLLGEIRDLETAQTTWQAALSGHLVLSTLHTNDAPSSVMRLRDIGIESYKIAAALKGVIAQRLLRRLCPRCAEPVDSTTLPAQWRPPAELDRPIQVRQPKGCSHCGFIGYRGRFAIEEILTVDGQAAEMIAQGALAETLLSSGRRYGMRTLWEAGLRRVWTGETSYQEVVRVVGEPLPKPAPAAPAAAAPAASGEAAVAPRAQPVVLVADDDAAIRALFTAVLESERYRVVHATDGLDALEQAQRLEPDILLLDMDMPRLNGFGVLERLRQRLLGRAVPVIVVTARDDPETETRCIEMGAEDYITKPIQPPTLLARVRAVLRRVGAGN
jgi:type IV pilus assembly protein PilB